MPKRSCLKSRPSEKCQGFNERTGCLIVNIETFGIRLVSSYCILHSISGDFSVVMGYDNRECGYVDTCQNFCHDMALHCCYICFQMFTFCWICSHFKHCPKFLLLQVVIYNCNCQFIKFRIVIFMFSV